MLLLPVLLALAAGDAARSEARITVSVRGEGESSTWSVSCEDASLDALVRAIAKKAGLAVEGSELLAQAPPVTVELERRSLGEVLEYALGSAGLRPMLARASLAILPDPASAVSNDIGISSPAFGEFGPVTTSSAFAPRCRAAIALYRRSE